MDKESLPEYLGGTSKATLLDDAGPWQDPALIAEIDAEWNALTGATDIKEEESEATSTGQGESSTFRSAFPHSTGKVRGVLILQIVCLRVFVQAMGAVYGQSGCLPLGRRADEGMFRRLGWKDPRCFKQCK